MSPTRREALAQLAATVASLRAGLAALPVRDWSPAGVDPLDATIAEYQAGRRRRAWTAADVTARCSTDSAARPGFTRVERHPAPRPQNVVFAAAGRRGSER